MRVADLDDLYDDMKTELEEMVIGDDFKAGFLYAMGIVRRERGIKIPGEKPEETHIHTTALELENNSTTRKEY